MMTELMSRSSVLSLAGAEGRQEGAELSLGLCGSAWEGFSAELQFSTNTPGSLSILHCSLGGADESGKREKIQLGSPLLRRY